MNKLMATTRIGCEVPKVSHERYPTDDERSQHCDDSGEHRLIIGPERRCHQYPGYRTDPYHLLCPK
jgi:hypothetical protein